ncbi:hypothetical protein ACJEP8_29170, partial [Klebsiella pneumoniae]
QIREILISESAWEEMTCLFAPSLGTRSPDVEIHISHPDEQRRVNHLILNETGIAIPCIDIELDE